MIAIIFLCMMKSHLFARFCEISRQLGLACSLLRLLLLFIKRWSKIAVSNIAIDTCWKLAF